MKKISMVLAAFAALLWSASWVNACDTCGCKAKAGAAKADGKAATVIAEPAVKCVACPSAQADATKPAAKCTGDCKAGCCKGDAAKCATCPIAKACKAQAAAGETKACGAALKACGAAAGKSCGKAATETEVKAEAPAKDAK